MKANRRPLAVLCLLGAGGLGGCMPGNYLASAPTPHDEVATACQSLPRCQRELVYVFVVNGLDPRFFGRMDVVCDYVHRLGFDKVYLGHLWDGSGFEEKIRKIHRDEPAAHFVLMGFGLGANVAKDMAQDFLADGIQVDLLVYLGCDYLEDTPEYRPNNVHRVVNVTGQACFWNYCGLADPPVKINGAENLRLEDAGHYDVPSRLKTLALLTACMGEVAARVVPPPTPVLPPPAAPPADSTLPPPRKAPPEAEKQAPQ